jgi:hypothetical protein
VNEQTFLFQPEQDVWIDRLWPRVPAATRQQILAILAEMAKTALAERASAEPKEAHDER